LDGVRASAGTHTILNQILRKIPIAVVDNDLSELSRRIAQTLDAWPARGNRLCRFVALAARRKL
jgi:hypothetical protein